MKFKGVVVTWVALAGALAMNGCTFAPTALGIASLFVDNRTPAAPVWRIQPVEPSFTPCPALPDFSAVEQHAALDKRR